MKADTPLPEVALILPTDAAADLLKASSAVQESVLSAVRSFMCELEESDVHLDPITLSVVLHALTLQLKRDHVQILGLMITLQTLLDQEDDLEKEVS